MVLVKLAWRQMRLRPGRTLLTLAGIMLGVAALTAVVILEANARQQFARVRETLSGKAAIEVVAQSGGRFDVQVADDLASTPGVAYVAPVLRQITTLYAGERKLKVMLIGLDAGREQDLYDSEVIAGKLAVSGDEIVVDEGLARSLKLKPGDVVRLLTRRLLQRRTIVGVVRARTGVGNQLGDTIFMPRASLGELFDAVNQADSLQVVLTSSSEPATVETALAKKLPKELTSRPAGSYQTLGEQNYALIDHALRATRVLLIVTAIFIALNTFLMNVGERQPMFAMMRAIGATSGQVVRMLLLEAVALGVLGGGLGAIAGLLGSGALIQSFQGTLGVGADSPPSLVTWLALGVTLGPIAALLAVAYPARLAARVNPLDGMRGSTGTSVGKTQPVFAKIGVVILLLGCVGMHLCAWKYWPQYLFAPSAGTTLLGAAALLNNLVGFFTGIVALAGRVWVRLETDLARRQVLRHPTRTWLTSATLFVALAASLAVGNAILNVTDGVRAWYDRSMPIDFVVRTTMPRLDEAKAADMPADMSRQVQQIPGVVRVDPASLIRCAVNADQAMLMAREYGLYQELPIDLRQGVAAEVREKLLAGEIVVNTTLAQQRGLKVGDRVELAVGEKSAEVRICGVMMEFAFPGNVVCLDRIALSRLLPPNSADAFLVAASPDRTSEVERALQSFADAHGFMLQTQREMHQTLDEELNGLIGGLRLLLVLAVIVASFGVFNTMAISVLEQTRELALMRAVGMEPKQVRRMFVMQGLMIAGLGLLPGLGVGWALGFAINRAFSLMLGLEMPFGLHPATAVAGAALAAAIVAVTAFALGARAARLPIRDGLAQT